MELWERSAALELLDDLLRRSATGGRVAVVSGEAGIGKSALVGEFVRRSGPGAWTLWGACDPLVTPRALGPLHDIGQQVGGVLRAKLTAGAELEEIFTAFLDALAAPRRRTQPVIVVEDAHWADEATLDWLVFLGRRMDRLRGLLIVTYRDDEVGPEHPLHRVLAALRSGLVSRVPLPALSQACVLEQARQAGRDAELVVRLGEGNPLLVTELLKADESAVPAAVQDLILDRIQLLSPPARNLAHLVAVVPTRADAPLVPASDLVAECIGAGVLVAAGEGVAYRHELLRSAVERSMIPARRAELHQHVLRVLTDEPGVDPGRLVHHARFAGNAEAVLHYGRIAGDAAARQGAHREAADHYRAAAAHADRLGKADRAELLERFAAQAHLAGRNEEALAALETAVAVREVLEQPEAVGEDLRQMAELAWWTGRRTQARDAMSRAMDLLESRPTSLEVAMAAYAARGQFAFRRHDLTDAVASGERAEELAVQLGDQDRALHIRVSTLVARLAAGDLTVWPSLEQIHRDAAARGDIDLAARALMSLASVVADELAEYAEAEQLVEGALAFTAQHDLEGFHLAMLSVRSIVRLERGDWSGALIDADATLAAAGDHGVNSILALVARGRIQAARGDPQALTTLDDAARSAEGVGDVPFVAPVADARSEYFLLVGDPERAYEEARRGLDYAGGEGGVPFTVGRLGWRIWRAGGVADEVPAVTAQPYRLMVEGEWSKAAEEWGRRGATYLRAEALAEGGEGPASEALTVLDGLGAVRAAQRLRAELRRRGITRVPRGPRRTTAANSAGLTAREVDVLALLVEGLTNAEIADRLSLSSKTVGHYISALLAKLDVRTRGQAAAAARRRNLVP